MIKKCELCGRFNECNQHHLIPKTNHKNKWFKKNFTNYQLNQKIWICKDDCHKNLHKIIGNDKTIGRYYNTKSKLLSHEKFKNYIEWIKKKN